MIFFNLIIFSSTQLCEDGRAAYNSNCYYINDDDVMACCKEMVFEKRKRPGQYFVNRVTEFTMELLRRRTTIAFCERSFRNNFLLLSSNFCVKIAIQIVN